VQTNANVTLDVLIVLVRLSPSYVSETDFKWGVADVPAMVGVRVTGV